MDNSVHAHNLLEMIRTASQPISRDSLAAAAREQFGPDARFYSCSSSDMDLDQTLDFLTSRRKVVEVDGRFEPGPEGPCKH